MAFLYVKAYHGRCKTFDSTVHKPQFLAGLRDHLQKLGFRVDLIPVEFTNYCMLEICGHEVFRCKLNHFHFNTESKRDAVCHRAINAVMEASVKFRRARAYLWFWTLLEHQLYKRSPNAPIDHWPQDTTIKPVAHHLECIKCCEIPVVRHRDGEYTKLV